MKAVPQVGNEWVAAGSVDEIGANEPVLTRAWGDEIAVYKVGDEYFANSNFCTHSGAPLSRGSRDGYILKCPVHQALFDVRDGRCAGGMKLSGLTHYEVRVRATLIEIRKPEQTAVPSA